MDKCSSLSAPTLLVATTNRGKAREIAGILEDVPLELISLENLGTIEEPEETGATFAENARLKALHYHHATGLPTVADDSGIEIEALGGLPGVHSARWESSDYAAKFRKIYEMLDARNARGSKARFVCRVAVTDRAEIIWESEGIIEGVIATSGLRPGERIVIRGAFTLKSELGKAELGEHGH